ncbi:PLDc N-terminal domain-containing protein [Flavobacterium succinicans]|uniref:Cardiolipin synthase N-terminal domain-containing protein n=1 Tax=Flavobacterium succinicans TaxID=29536 RepID=A0A199XQW3_9FLAO|nr:PLDc N-terminal domain-containing protein [Flavobacterium succinicans]OAZ03714.1 hypothetical protein FLB_19920 [Flavobacterium succinicans]
MAIRNHMGKISSFEIVIAILVYGVLLLFTASQIVKKEKKYGLPIWLFIIIFFPVLGIISYYIKGFLNKISA